MRDVGRALTASRRGVCEPRIRSYFLTYGGLSCSGRLCALSRSVCSEPPAGAARVSPRRACAAESVLSLPAWPPASSAVELAGSVLGWEGQDNRQELVTKSHAVETLPPHQRSVLYAAVRARSARVSPCTWDKITPLLTLMSFLLPPAASPAVLRPCGSSFCLQTCLRAFARAMSSLQKAFLPRGCLIFITQAWLMCHLLGDTFPCQPV